MVEAARPIVPEPVRFRTADGLTLVGDAWGEAHRPCVLLVHGGGQTRHAWGGTAEALAMRGWYAVTVDQRGHGDSGWSSDGRYGIDLFGADLRDVAAALPGRPAVVGASLGGIASLIAEGESDKPVFSAIVLVDITPRVSRAGVEHIVDFMNRHKDTGFGSLEEAADAVAAYLPHRPRPKDLSGLAKNLRQKEDGRWYWHWDPRFVTTTDRRVEERDPIRLEAAAKRIGVPILLVRGRMSDLVTEEHARAFLELVPHAQFADVSGAGHMVAGDKNDVFTRAVIDFLRLLPEGHAGP